MCILTESSCNAALFTLWPMLRITAKCGITKVDRISDVDVQTLKFPKPNEFNLESHLSGSFGVYRGTSPKDIHVRVRFAADVARYVQEKRWHASQKLTPQ